jgi:integrase
MNGHVRKMSGSTWGFVVDVPRQPARRCNACGRRYWCDEKPPTACEKCGGDLGAPQPERRQKWHSGFKTKTAAQNGLRDALNRMDRGEEPVPTSVTLAEFVDTWEQHMEVHDKPRLVTRTNYLKLVRRWVLPAIGTVRLDRVRVADVQGVLDAMVAAGKAPGTVAHTRAALSSCFAFALRGQLVQSNPVRATTTPTRRAPQLHIPTPEQLLTLIEKAKGTPWEVPVLLSATTGARRAEVLAMRWEYVDLDRGRVRVVDTMQRLADGTLGFAPTKTERARRQIPLPGFVVDRLRRLRVEQAERRLKLGEGWHDWDLVCERGDGLPLDPMSYTHAFGRIAKSVGLEKVRLHDCRHAVATMLAKSGTPGVVTSAVMGHSSVAFTLSVYTHVDEEQVERAAAGLEQAFGS